MDHWLNPSRPRLVLTFAPTTSTIVGNQSETCIISVLTRPTCLALRRGEFTNPIPLIPPSQSPQSQLQPQLQSQSEPLTQLLNPSSSPNLSPSPCPSPSSSTLAPASAPAPARVPAPQPQP
ncbi:hypothetical protein PoB_007165500 [Plakobranchus ocellatus]|uniref:Uncharacterized protein n=1 Tax=Plakobranchus ocellatus TaxID=259542 RepID=A0AAV4DM83_9GAST|nr:hypothetical protein PoB_007165500 [Plakobranchus ocellatus]